jgi:hypothetical protein
MFNTQYQTLIDDHKRYSNFNNNNDQRKFVINYVTINNYYGTSPSNEVPKLQDLVNNSNFLPEFSNPSTHLTYRK